MEAERQRAEIEASKPILRAVVLDFSSVVSIRPVCGLMTIPDSSACPSFSLNSTPHLFNPWSIFVAR